VTVLLIAAWFGLVSGMVEGVLFLICQWFGKLMYVSLKIVWVSAVFNLLLFGAIGLLLMVVRRFFRPLPVVLLSVSLFAFLTVLDWVSLLLTGHIHKMSILILSLGLTTALTRWFRKHETAALRFCFGSLPGVTAVAFLALVGVQGGLWLHERMAIASLPPAAQGSLNVLMIVVDALRADHLSSYGYSRPTSPNMDRIASQGVLFENAFATSSYTLPSHASLVSGRYPHEHGVEWSKPMALVDSRYPTLAEALVSRGYRTAAFSANLFWFVGAAGFSRGFIRFEDYFHCISDMVLRTLYGRAIENFILRRIGFEDIPARKRASDINRSLIRWLENDKEKPFFALLNYMDTHDPYLPPSPYRTKFSRFENPGGILNWRVGRADPQMSNEQLQGEIDAYDGGIAYVDHHIGQLMAELQTRGLIEKTLVVITSDHGESFGDHGVFLHGNHLYRNETHVPLIIWRPGQIPAGILVTRPCTNAALPATVMDLVGYGDQTFFPGPSLSKLWTTSPVDPGLPYPLAEIEQISWAPERAPAHHGWVKSLVSPKWHFIVHEKLGPEVYDLNSDIEQLHNLAQTSEGRRVVYAMHQRLKMSVGMDSSYESKRGIRQSAFPP
jgi:arylsulfatase A-like enzyme